MTGSAAVTPAERHAALTRPCPHDLLCPRCQSEAFRICHHGGVSCEDCEAVWPSWLALRDEREAMPLV